MAAHERFRPSRYHAFTLAGKRGRSHATRKSTGRTGAVNMSKEKLTKEGIEDAVRLTKMGLMDQDVAAYLGVAPQTYCRWKNRPKSDNQRSLSSALKKAEVERKGALLGRILKASDETWQAAAWLLERRYPAEFAKPVRPVEDTHLAKADENIKGFIDALGLR